MRRLLVISAVATALLIGTVVVVSAQTPKQEGWGCGGTGVAGTYDYTADPTFEAVAEKLGIGAADLAKELQAGKSVADVAGEQNVKLEDLVAVVDAPRREMMDLMAKYGYATQEQIDAMNDRMESWQRQALEEKGSFGVMGPGMMRGGGMMGPGMMGGQGGFGGMMGGMMRGGGMMSGLRAN